MKYATTENENVGQFQWINTYTWLVQVSEQLARKSCNECQKTDIHANKIMRKIKHQVYLCGIDLSKFYPKLVSLQDYLHPFVTIHRNVFLGHIWVHFGAVPWDQ